VVAAVNEAFQGCELGLLPEEGANLKPIANAKAENKPPQLI